MKWEYKVCPLAANNAPDIQTLLNNFGKERWELINFDDNHERVYYFKRPFVEKIKV